MNIGAIVFAAATLAVGVVYAGMGANMPRGSLAYPGPGLFPTIIGVFLVATALGCLVQEIVSARKRAKATDAALPDEPSGRAGPRHFRKTVELMALLVAYMFALKPLGFPLAIFGFSALAIRIFGYRAWGSTLAMAAVIAAVSYVTFVMWLKVALPLGLLEPLLG